MNISSQEFGICGCYEIFSNIYKVKLLNIYESVIGRRSLLSLQESANIF